MKFTKIFRIITFILLIAVASIGFAVVSSRLFTPRLTLDLLKNSEYHFIDGPVRLVDGVYQERVGFTTPTLLLWEEPIVFADINSDGFEDAILFLEFYSGGSAHGPILVVVLNQNGKPYDAAESGLGDRTKIKAIRVDDRTITLDVVTHSEDDALCCPTLDATWQFRFENNKLTPLQ